MTEHRAFFGDGDHRFKLGLAEITELERKVGGGIGAICRRLFAGEFSHADVVETIRLALIGGGLSPERAYQLVDAYVIGRPLTESYSLAVAILEALWFGSGQSTNAPSTDIPSKEDFATGCKIEAPSDD